MRIALGQMAATTDKVANLRAVAGVIQGASEGGAELVVLPEAAISPGRASRPPSPSTGLGRTPSATWPPRPG